MKLLNMLIAAFDEIDRTAPEYKVAMYGNGRLGAINPYEKYIGAPISRLQERMKQKPRRVYPHLPVITLPRGRSKKYVKNTL